MDLETILAASLALGALFVLVFYFIFRSPFRYQYRIFEIDISGKHSPDIKDIIDDLLIREGIVGFSTHKQLVDQWKINCQNRVEKSLFKKLRAKQFAKCVDDERMFCFKLVRRKTQYKQVNYVKSPYYVYKTVVSTLLVIILLSRDMMRFQRLILNVHWLNIMQRTSGK